MLLAERAGASWLGRSVDLIAGQWQTGAPSSREWQGAQSCQSATELVFPGPTLGQMQSEATRRAGEPSGEGEEAPPLTKRPPNWFASGGMGHAARAADGSGDVTQPGIGRDSATGRFT